MDDSKMTLREWLGFKERVEYENARWFGRLFGFLVVALTIILALALFAALARIVGMVFSSDATSIRNLGYVVLGAIGVPFAAWRTHVAQRQADVSEQSHITDQISKAVEQLGTEKTIDSSEAQITVPNLEVRIGGLLALERILKSNPSEEKQVIEILKYYAENGIDERRKIDSSEVIPLRSDIVFAFKILNRVRSATSLQTLEPKGFDEGIFRFQFCRLDNFQLVRGDLSNLGFHSSNFNNSSLFSCSFKRTNLSVCNFSGARFAASDLSGANLDSSNFSGAKFIRTTFSDETEMSSATFVGACFIECDLTQSDITQSQLDGTYGGDCTILPSKLQRPAHWHPDALYTQDWQSLLVEWQQSIGFDFKTNKIEEPT